MWGLFYSTFISIGVIINKFKKEKENKDCKILYRNIDNLTYTDREGKTRLLSDDSLVFYVLKKKGEYILEDATGKTIYNFSNSKREKKIKKNKEEAVLNKKSTYCIDDNSHKYDWIKKGKRFKDLETGNIYIIRYINHKFYFMDINTGFLIRETDWQKQSDYKKKNNQNNYGVNIKQFNNKQKEIKNLTLLFREFDYNSSCDYYY